MNDKFFVIQHEDRWKVVAPNGVVIAAHDKRTAAETLATRLSLDPRAVQKLGALPPASAQAVLLENPPSMLVSALNPPANAPGTLITVPLWQANTFFAQNSLVLSNHFLYECNADHISGATFTADSSFWSTLIASTGAGFAALGTDGKVGGPGGSLISPTVGGGNSRINLLDGTVTIDTTGVTPCDAAFDSQLLRARQAGLALEVPAGIYKRTTPLLLVSGDHFLFPGGWINTTIEFAFSSPDAAIQALDPTDATTDVGLEGSVQITGDSTNTTVGVFVATGQKWEWGSIRVGRGFTQSSMVFYGQRWRDEGETSAGVASSTSPKGILTAAVGAADTTVSLTNTIQYQEPARWPWGFSIAKLISPKTTLSANLIGASRTVTVADGTKLTNSGAIMLASTGEIIFYANKSGNQLLNCVRNYYGHISTVVSGVLVYQVELISYTGYSGGQFSGVVRGLRGTTAIAHGADIAAPTLAGSPHTGGALTGTNFFVIEALNGVLQSIASNEVSVTYSGGNLSAGLTWGAVTGATGYRLHVTTASGVYRGSIDVGNVTSFTYTGQSTTNTGAPFGVYQNPGSTTRNTFGKIDAEAGTYPMMWTGTTGLDVAQTTTLSGNGGSISPSATTINFASSGALNAYKGVDGPAGTTLIYINGEIIQGTVSGSSLTSCQRGLYLTTAASHTDGDGVYAVFRRNGGDANQTTIDDLLIASNLTVSVACWFMQGAGNTIGNSNASASNPGTPGDCFRFDWYSNTLVSAITGPTGTAGYEFNFVDAGELSGDNLVLNHDVEGGSPSNYGAAVIFDPAGRNTVVGYRNGIKLRRVNAASGTTWLAANDLLWNNNGVPTWRNPSGVDSQVLTQATSVPQVGSHAARLASSPAAGQFWQESDTGLIYFYDGAAWQIYKSDGQVLKGSDQTVNNSAVLVADTALFFPIAVNEQWFVEALLFCTGASATADFGCGWSGPTGSSGKWAVTASGAWVAVTTASTPTAVKTSMSTVGGTSIGQWGALAGTIAVLVAGVFTADASHAGNINFLWCQATATAENNVVNAGSLLRLRRLA